MHKTGRVRSTSNGHPGNNQPTEKIMLQGGATTALLVPVFLVLAFSVLFLTFPGHAYAQPVGFKVVEVSANSGNNAYSYYGFPGLNELGEVCFRGAGATSTAILKSDGTIIREVARADARAETFGLFVSGVCSINDQGLVAFDACADCDFAAATVAQTASLATASNASVLAATLDNATQKGIYTGDGLSAPTLIQGTGPNPSDFKSAVFPSLNNANSLSFSGELNDGTQGIWVHSGGGSSPVFDSSGALDSLGAAFLNNKGELTFGASEDGSNETGIYNNAGAVIASTANGAFTQFSVSVLNDLSSIAFLGSRIVNGSVEEGVYFNGNARITNATGAFLAVELSPFQALSVNDLGDVVFPAIRSNGDPVVFISLDGGLIKLFERGDLLPGHGSPIDSIRVGRESINSKRQIALLVEHGWIVAYS